MDWLRQLQDETINIQELGFGTSYIRSLTVCCFVSIIIYHSVMLHRLHHQCVMVYKQFIIVTSNECKGISIRHFLHPDIKGNIKVPKYQPFVRGIHQCPVDSPHKRPVMGNAFSCHDIIMIFVSLARNVCASIADV